MPSVELQNRNQYVVLWAASGYDNYGGYQVSSPVEILVRWEDEQRQSTGAQDSVVATPATLWIDRVVAPGSIVWKGRLKDLPAAPTNLKEVATYEETPDLKGRNVQRCVTLTKYNDQLPTVV